MELFNTIGFNPGDKVFTVLNDKKYFGVVLDIDEKRNKIKVDYSTREEKAVDWFSVSFWEKVI